MYAGPEIKTFRSIGKIKGAIKPTSNFTNVNEPTQRQVGKAGKKVRSVKIESPMRHKERNKLVNENFRIACHNVLV